ncbi:hypothetical protein FPCIR_11401 [Fusarium pseudocircinatum]|uniref:Uncharacterized protein n=1 Tax=Fusarium pseudocircinatum TaxID=56676 RepID=A0A8H5NVV8_9HYPO|nr:hypothetical protein FPCIR_11401 [Fusarium pseudocircinatum]
MAAGKPEIDWSNATDTNLDLKYMLPNREDNIWFPLNGGGGEKATLARSQASTWVETALIFPLDSVSASEILNDFFISDSRTTPQSPSFSIQSSIILSHLFLQQTKAPATKMHLPSVLAAAMVLLGATGVSAKSRKSGTTWLERFDARIAAYNACKITFQGTFAPKERRT